MSTTISLKQNSKKQGKNPSILLAFKERAKRLSNRRFSSFFPLFNAQCSFTWKILVLAGCLCLENNLNAPGARASVRLRHMVVWQGPYEFIGKQMKWT
jgi:hypothetical protein